MEYNYKGLFKGFDFLAYRKLALFIALGFCALGIGIYFTNGGFTMGTDFSGGLRVEFTAEGADVGEVRTLITGNGVAITTLQIEGVQSFLLTAPANAQGENATEAYLKPIRDKYGVEKVSILSSSFVGPSVGYDFTLQAIRLVGIVALLILIYVAFRFDYMYGMGAILSSLHDILVMAVVVLFFRIPVDLTILASFLTILGYSINDTIVIFDRIRENHEALPEEDLAPIINKSISQCMVRTILTSLTTLFVAISIYVWAGAALQNFGLMMIVGIVAGVYSSMFVASPITYLLWKAQHDKKHKKVSHSAAK